MREEKAPRPQKKLGKVPIPHSLTDAAQPCPWRSQAHDEVRPVSVTKVMDIRGFDSGRILSLRRGIIVSIGDFQEILSQAILVRDYLSREIVCTRAMEHVADLGVTWTESRRRHLVRERLFVKARVNVCETPGPAPNRKRRSSLPQARLPTGEELI